MSMPTVSPSSPKPGDIDTAPAVRVDRLTRVFRTPMRRQKLIAVRELSLEVKPGEIYGLIGPNGSGKSTTMKCLLGLVRPSAGSCSIFGRDSRSTASRREVGFLPENPYFYKHLSGRETIRFYGRLCGLRGRALEERADELLEFVGLSDAADRRLGGYSKGMLQRIGLAQALVHHPRLLVLDEPTAGVDPRGSRVIRDLVLGFKERGITVMLCSHLLEQVQEVCDRVGIIYEGRMVREGRTEDLIAVENQTEIVLENADTALLEELRRLVTRHAADRPGAASGAAPRWLRDGRPRTTLERLFLEATGDSSRAGAPAADAHAGAAPSEQAGPPADSPPNEPTHE